MRKLTVGSLFAGIGGLELGLEMTGGFETVWQVEIDEYARQVLAKHWPNVRRHHDVRTFPPEGDWSCDVICGGFPCQDISTANPSRTGIAGKRSGLWTEFARVVSEVGPRIVIVENVANVATLGLDLVLGDLANMGFDAEWATLSASEFGAPQSRRRTFIVAYPMRERWPLILRGDVSTFGKAAPWGEWQSHSPNTPCDVLQAVEQSVGQSSVLRSSDGIRSAVDRLRVIGNAVVPQVAQWIGQRILDSIDQNGG